MVIVPPPTSFFVFTSERSGSMPVVSQSIMKLMVPVGASTETCALRTPTSSASSATSSHTAFASLTMATGARCRSMLSTDWRCIASTPSIGRRFSSKPL